MSSDTDHPRQRTVAELLAQHGGDGTTPRPRRRRRAPEEPDGTPEQAAAWRPGTEPDRSILRERVPTEESPAPLPRRVAEPVRWDPPAEEPTPRPLPRRAAAPATAAEQPTALFTPAADPARDRPTDKMPRVQPKVEEQAIDPGLTAPIRHQRPEPLDDGGPPTVAGAPPAAEDRWPPAPSADVFGDAPAGLADAPDEVEQATDRPQQDGGGQAWAAVVIQWIVGALAGAALWVGFRFLWRSLPVVAIAAAVIVTIALVVLVRHLVRKNDLRTTLFAVGVGLLLTVSPAILVLLGR